MEKALVSSVRARALQVNALLLTGLAGSAFTPCAPAQVPPTAAALAKEASGITWKGITLYGVLDLGLQYQTHGVPVSDYVAYSTEPVIQKNSNGSVTSLVSSPLSWSRIGLSGKEPLAGDWSGIFRLETYFNPTSGELSDGLKSLTLNNGRASSVQTTNLDSSVAGQAFGGGAYVGLSSPRAGTLTFGRQLAVLAQGIVDYDPIEDGQDSGHAFSLLGGSRTAAGGGSTEDTRLDHSLKYAGRFEWFKVGALYQFNDAAGSANTAIQAQIGVEAGGASVDAYVSKKYDAISASALSASQLKALSPGYSASNSVAATVSDNTAYALMGRYTLSRVKLYAGYENIHFANPNSPLPAGTVDIGGYVLADVNNTAYDNHRILQIYWAGARWQASPRVYVAASYYGYHQNSYASGAAAGCSSNLSSGCSGSESGVGILGAYSFSPRFEVYAGSVWTDVQRGLSSGFLYNATITSTVGARFKL